MTTTDERVLCPSMSQQLAQYLALHGVQGKDLQVFALSCISCKDSSSGGAVTKEKTLVLVMEGSVLVVGLLVTRYPAASPPLVYVDKLDSSGHLVSRGSPSLASLVVRGLLETYRGHSRVHVFARAQPQFLFPLSASNPNKHILEVALFAFIQGIFPSDSYLRRNDDW
jgi:hypothetical protein